MPFVLRVTAGVIAHGAIRRLIPLRVVPLLAVIAGDRDGDVRVQGMLLPLCVRVRLLLRLLVLRDVLLLRVAAAPAAALDAASRLGDRRVLVRLAAVGRVRVVLVHRLLLGRGPRARVLLLRVTAGVVAPGAIRGL